MKCNIYNWKGLLLNTYFNTVFCHVGRVIDQMPFTVTLQPVESFALAFLNHKVIMTIYLT